MPRKLHSPSARYLPKHIPLRSLKDGERKRFLELVGGNGRDDECWEWNAAKTAGGYGTYRRFGSHRVAYYLATGIDPGDAQVCHRCDNPSCCNPAHLFIGSHGDNMADKVAKGRARGRYSKSHGNRTNHAIVGEA